MAWWNILLAIVLSFLPIVELRGGIPMAILSGINPWAAFILCVFVNILITPFAFFFLDKIHVWLLPYNWYKRSINRIFEKAKKRSGKVKKNIDTWGMLALTIFVAIPLPGTGAWTGSLIAWLLKLNKKKSFWAITLGVILAGIIVTLAVTGLVALFKVFI
jgi:uncharacterized membrane protein